jgi:hypothetical protein
MADGLRTTQMVRNMAAEHGDMQSNFSDAAGQDRLRAMIWYHITSTRIEAMDFLIRVATSGL